MSREERKERPRKSLRWNKISKRDIFFFFMTPYYWKKKKGNNNKKTEKPDTVSLYERERNGEPYTEPYTRKIFSIVFLETKKSKFPPMGIKKRTKKRKEKKMIVLIYPPPANNTKSQSLDKKEEVLRPKSP